MENIFQWVSIPKASSADQSRYHVIEKQLQIRESFVFTGTAVNPLLQLLSGDGL